jgi:hypothetical protein
MLRTVGVATRVPRTQPPTWAVGAVHTAVEAVHTAVGAVHTAVGAVRTAR